MRTRVHAVPRPTGRGVGVVAAFLGLVALTVGTGTAELAPLTAAVGLPVVVAPFAAFVRGRRVQKRLAVDAAVSPALCVVGGEVTLRIGVTNRSERPAPALSVESPGRRWRRRGDAATTGTPSTRLVPSDLVTLPAPAPRTRAVFVSRVPSPRRGVFVLPARAAWVLDPFGLFGVPGPVVGGGVSAVLYPAAEPVARWPVAVGGAWSKAERAPSPGPGRDGPGELVGIRPYVAGDRLSLLHWPARARYGTWFVRQFAAEQGAQTRLVLDDRAGVHRQADFEAMLAEAHGLMELCWRQGRTVELGSLSGRSATLAPAAAGLEEARVLLAALLPRAAGADLEIGGTVLTTATGARSLPDGVDRIVVGP